MPTEVENESKETDGETTGVSTEEMDGKTTGVDTEIPGVITPTASKRYAATEQISREQAGNILNVCPTCTSKSAQNNNFD